MGNELIVACWSCRTDDREASGGSVQELHVLLQSIFHSAINAVRFTETVRVATYCGLFCRFPVTHHKKMSSQLSLVHGPKEPSLWVDKTLCAVIDEQESSFADRTALIVPWQSARLTYRQLAERSRVVAKALLAAGLNHGDCIGIMDGNSCEYIEIFLGAARVGCPVVVLNNTYSPDELRNAVYRSCRALSIRRISELQTNKSITISMQGHFHRSEHWNKKLDGTC